MNNRDYKKFAPNVFHHSYNRGVGKQDIFLDDDDRRFFLSRLKESIFPHLQQKTVFLQSQEDRLQTKKWRYVRKSLPEGSFTFLCYCLMPNHFHFLIRQNLNIPISKIISKVCTSYSKYFNKKYNRVGHVFQDKFKSVLVVSDSQLLWLSAYIHNNPKTAGLVKNLEDWQWSSYPDYTSVRKGTLCDKSFILGMTQNNENTYKKFVEDSYGKIKARKDLENLLLDE